MANAEERALRAQHALRRIDNKKKKDAERQRREREIPVNAVTANTAGPNARVTSAATSGAPTPRPKPAF